LGVVLKETPKSKKVALKRFLKAKASKFPNVIFLYYVANLISEKDMAKFQLLNKPKEKYPLVYFVWNGVEILYDIENANIESISECFGEMKNYYQSDLKNKMNPQDEKDSDKEIKSHLSLNENDENEEEENNNNKKQEQQEQIVGEIKQVSRYQNERLIDKLALLNDEKNKQTIIFLEDIKARRKLEEKQNKKNKKSKDKKRNR
jgi:hypothetical protein